jgi:hypothetical protein
MPTGVELLRRVSAAWSRRRLDFAAAVFLAGLLMFSCGGNGGTVPVGIAAEFTESGTQAEDNRVRMVGGSSSEDVVTVEVVCGETDRTDVYGFAFDLVLGDQSVAEYVAGSVQAGNVFQGMLAVAQQNGNRIVIGVSQTDQTGDRIPGPESVLLRLNLRVLRTGITTIRFEGSTGSNPSNEPSALDSNGNPIGSVVFDPSPASVVGR